MLHLKETFTGLTNIQFNTFEHIFINYLNKQII